MEEAVIEGLERQASPWGQEFNGLVCASREKVAVALATAPLRDHSLSYAPEDQTRWCVDFVYLVGSHPDFQASMVTRFGGKCLNVGCQNDPAGLGNLGVINLDFEEVNPAGEDYRKVKNFIKGDARNLQFDDESFDLVILGEFLEHCTQEMAATVVSECRRVLKNGHHLVITVPLDGSFTDPRYDNPRAEVCPGITYHHQTWWSNRMLEELRNRCRLVEDLRSVIMYLFPQPCCGWGLLWRKP